jgi:hypothetical protein
VCPDNVQKTRCLSRWTVWIRHRGRRGGTGRANSKKELLTGPIRGFCALQAFHDTEVHANNALETDHGRLKARLRPMRGLKRDRTARAIVAGHAFVQNLRRGFYDLGTDVRPALRLADAFAELTFVI